MVKAIATPPSVIEYCVQNEIEVDHENPDTIALLEATCTKAPSRSIVLSDGFVASPRPATQAWLNRITRSCTAPRRNREEVVESAPGRVTNGTASSISRRPISPNDPLTA